MRNKNKKRIPVTSTEKKEKVKRVQPTPAHIAKIISLGDPDVVKWFVPLNIEPIADYSLEILLSTLHQYGIRWNAHLYKGDQAILEVRNNGLRSSNTYHPIRELAYRDDLEWQELLATFKVAAREAYGDDVDPHDRACSLLDHIALLQRKYASEFGPDN